MIDRILKTYGEVNTTVKHFPPDELSKGSFLVTLDVSSLYSNIPHKDGIEACLYFMSENGCASRDSVQGISKLIELVLIKNHFQFNDENYIQRLYRTLHCLWEILRKTS